MPELPEVETISRQLERVVSGKKIKKIEVSLPKIVKAPLVAFGRALQGAIIKKISRRAKILIFEMDNGWSLLVHLKMTGQLIFSEEVCSRHKHTHVIFNFADGSQMLFNDLRQFGYLKLARTEELDAFFIKEGLGPEPLPASFTLARFKEVLLKKPKAKIKQFLMDPKNIAGIGNIYSDEILFASRVHPLQRVFSLKQEEIKKIYDNIKKILSLAVKLRGTSSSDYLDAFGKKGKFAQELRVYGREGEKCVKCKSSIVRIKAGGRSAHFCPACQRLKP
ncbi:MAG TPA: DNA-formamidopyrimidine glycosylase [Candidatus Portnoybacteria bacterium]|nr:DNA-formamidopyrimidine glycosylase [Candidatus Portnoybacteria bacterium]